MPIRDSFVVEFSSVGAAALARATRRIQSGFSALGKGVAGALGGVQAKIAAVTAAVGTLGLSAALKSSSDRLRDLNKEAAKMDIGIEKMQALRDTAQLAGVDVGQITDAMQEFQMRLREQGKLSPDLIEAAGFEPKGRLSARETAMSMDTGAQLATILRSLSGLQGKEMRQFIADELFGGAAQDIMSIVNRGGLDWINEVGQRNRDLGLDVGPYGDYFQQAMGEVGQVFSNLVDAFTSSKEVAALAGDFRDAVVSLVKELGGGKKIAADFAEGVRDVVRAMREWSGLPGGIGSSIGKGLAEATMQSTSEIDRIYLRRLNEGKVDKFAPLQSARDGKIQVEDRQLNETMSGFLKFGIPATVAP